MFLRDRKSHDYQLNLLRQWYPVRGCFGDIDFHYEHRSHNSRMEWYSPYRQTLPKESYFLETLIVPIQRND